jgi:cell division protease FtsH
MTLDAWLPIGHRLPDGARTRIALFEGTGWQVLETQGGGRALLVDQSLHDRWVDSGILDAGVMQQFAFGPRSVWFLSCSQNQVLCPVASGAAPATKAEALAFAMALRGTREIDRECPLQDALYVERISRLLPTYGISSRSDDGTVFGYWLTGGAPISVGAFRRLNQTLSWLGREHLAEIVRAGGFKVDADSPLARPEAARTNDARSADEDRNSASTEIGQSSNFDLPGRPELTAFLNEYVIDIINNRDRYQALGIGFPGAVVLHGPPGCGKTYAVEKLVEFLGWPSFQIDASSVASPYIHDTSKKVAELFGKAMKSAPSVLVIDEMESFLADRESNAGHHHVEEVAEFLRRIPEAAKNDVLVVAMTNKLEMIDQAVLRRGRFDHIVNVSYASEAEVRALLDKLFDALPKEGDIDIALLAKSLANRPLSDVAFVVREGARLAARSGRARIDAASLERALASATARTKSESQERRIGFV